jgi:ornithine decarboxylase
MLAPVQPSTDGFDFTRVRERLAGGYDGPFVILDRRLLRDKVRQFRAAMPRVRPHFAVKANHDPEVLRVFVDERVPFDVASKAEIEVLRELGVDAGDMYYSNPIKTREFVEFAAQVGVQWYVVDAVEELHKVVSIMPGASLYLRISVSNDGARWPLSGKFGANPDEARAVIEEAARVGARLRGVTFHVGSQCLDANSWRRGIEASLAVMDRMRDVGLEPSLLNIGGGFPIPLREPVPDIYAIGHVVNAALRDVPDDIEVMAEPGRYFVGDAGWFVCRVLGTATRGGQRWAYLDAGHYHGLPELADGFEHRLVTDRTGPEIPWKLAGPTCDSIDTFKGTHELPVGLREGDYLFVEHGGAYTAVCSTPFNGFVEPKVYVV